MKQKILLLFLLALVLRLLLVFTAYHGDLNNNISWGNLALERGLVGFYESGDFPFSAPNQPPLTILMFASLAWLWKTIDNIAWWLNDNVALFYSPFIWFWESRGATLLVKLPSIFADLGIGWLIYEYFNRMNKKNLGLKLSVVWLFNPLTWYNSSVWGQTDSIVNLFGLVAVFSLLNKKLMLFAFWFMLSLLFKGSLAIFAPILFFVALWQKHPLASWVKAGVVSLLVVFITSVWFHPQIDLFSWLVNLYQTRILPGEIGFLTANAFNFWWLVDPGRTLDSTVYFGLPARVWGFGLALTGLILILAWLRKRFSDKAIFYSLVATSLITFLFMTRIHERYLYPFFPYGTMLLGMVPGFALPYSILSITHLLNLYHLFWAPSIPSLEALYTTSWLATILFLVNIATLFWILRLGRKHL